MGSQDFCLIFTVVIVIGADFQAHALDNPLHQRLMTCHPSDLRALQGFMAVLQTKIQGWEEDNAYSNCCQWDGVNCDSSSSLGLESQSSSSSFVKIRRVVKLELPSKRLVGKLSESLGSLDQLRTLNLSHNFLKSSLPVSVFNLSNLRVLDLSNNDFSGPVSDAINLPSILHLDLSQNFLNGSLPSRICGVSSALRVLKLAGNSFSGEVPYGFGNCGSLEHLNIGMNDLSGESKDLFRLRKLSDLIIAGNRLSGSLSEGIGNLTSLFHLDISLNGFSGTIPNVFNGLGKLQSFVAHSNCFTGNIPESLSNSPTITRLNLRNNSLEGTIELNCSAMVNLTSLDLATNQFSGLIPDNLPSCQHLNNLNLARNNFTGEIPQSFKDFHSLSYFSLSNTTTTNLLSAFRILQQCKNLTTLVLSLNNFHDDELPADPDLHFDRLKVLVIANCGLTGSVPQWLRKSEKLQVLDLSCNNLVGKIPGWLGDFRSLFYLDISNNYFIGEIPRSLTALPSLISRDTPIQEPSPDFPFFMKRNTSARGLLYNRAGSFPPTLDLCCNNLSGPIWPEFGNLRKLHVLDLKFNDLSGEIPSALSGMSSLETLYLSHNRLSGTLPSSLVGLSFLSEFSVAYNKLHGPIPLGGQFQTFPSSSFEGNDLWGDQASSCNATENHIPGEEWEESTRDTSFVDGITGGIGFGVAFGLVIGAILFHETSKYYSSFEKFCLCLKL